jgi:hypothetical protein
MLGVAGVLGQEILRPDVFWYEAGLPENLPGPFKNINMGGLLAWEFILMHWVEVRRWQDYKNFGSVNEVRPAGKGWGKGGSGQEGWVHSSRADCAQAGVGNGITGCYVQTTSRASCIRQQPAWLGDGASACGACSWQKQL